MIDTFKACKEYEMTREDLGYQPKLEEQKREYKLDGFELARVIAEHRERYVVHTGTMEYEAEIIGNLRFTAQNRSDFPAVGDWVAISEFDDRALIHAILPRESILERQAICKHGEKQIIATNIDVAFIVQAVDRDFSVNRIERYLTLCHTSGISPVILLNKIDIVDEGSLSKLVNQVQTRIEGIPILAISNESQEGIDAVSSMIEKGRTYCLLGSSGVGKSTLLNSLSGAELMDTGSISDSTERGKHVTTHRELVVLETGGVIIDNPGMREVGVTESSQGLESTFSMISELGQECRFKDCSHISEEGCAVIEAVSNGEIDEETYQNYLRLEREKEHFESTVAERRKKDKAFGKMVKNIMKHKGKRKM